jgi:trans-aconitate methyltransferase
VKEFFKDHEDIRTVLDAGCGNGRDSVSLGERYMVDGVDNCGHMPPDTESCRFFIDNFVTLEKSKYDLIYSRFTFHSITNEDHVSFIKSIQKGYVCIETRSVKSAGEVRVFQDNHYRNFTEVNYMVELLKRYDFDILYIVESRDLAVYRDENPYCIRVICKKKPLPSFYELQ